MAKDGKAKARREALVGAIADALLAAGVAQIPLRDLAAGLGTSDRMLLYYFEDKSDLVRASIGEVSTRLGRMMQASIDREPRPPARVMADASGFLASGPVAPFMRVWSDVVARGGRGEAPFADIARETVQGSLAWLEGQLDLPPGAERRRVAAAILAVVEGARLIDMAAPGAMAGAAELIASRL